LRISNRGWRDMDNFNTSALPSASSVALRSTAALRAVDACANNGITASMIAIAFALAKERVTVATLFPDMRIFNSNQ
jgi:aryl-alcohol dehydrogenase-like predicted oxidoreductase